MYPQINNDYDMRYISNGFNSLPNYYNFPNNSNSFNATSPIYNMMFATILGILITNSTYVLPRFIMYFIHSLIHFLDPIKIKLFGKTNEVILSSIVQTSSVYGICEMCPIEYDAIIHKINSKNINTISVRNKINNSSQYGREFIPQNDNNPDDKICKYKICHNERLTLSAKYDIHIKCTITNDNNNSFGRSQNNVVDNGIYFNLHVQSNKLIVSEIIKKIDKWRKKFINHKKCYVDDGNIYYYYISRHEQKDFDIYSPGNLNFGMQPFNNAPKKMQTNSIIAWYKHKLFTTKTFDNIFFEDKNILLKRMNYFLNNKHEYDRKGIPYNLGLLFYGPAGCGKTSCIKALSNYTKRHVVEINLKNIKTCGEFINVFRNEFLNDDYIPINQRIIVLEDIDCMLNIVKQRDAQSFKNTNNQTKSIDNQTKSIDNQTKSIDNQTKSIGSQVEFLFEAQTESLFETKTESSLKDQTKFIDNQDNLHKKLFKNSDDNLSGNSTNHIISEQDEKNDMTIDDMLKSAMLNSYNRNMDTNETLTLSCILNTIDGILEQNGRIIIITTNYKDKLDNALLRPGRIDVRINFTKCTEKMTKDIIEHFYDESVQLNKKFPNDVYTPAEIVEKCFNNPDNMDKVINDVSV